MTPKYLCFNCFPNPSALITQGEAKTIFFHRLENSLFYEVSHTRLTNHLSTFFSFGTSTPFCVLHDNVSMAFQGFALFSLC